MSHFDFDHVPNRLGTGCYKWDEDPSLLPMHVADMDFAVAPCIVDAIKKRAEHPVFGYNIITKEWKQAYINFYQRRYDWTFEEENITFITGVVPAVTSAIRAYTEVDDPVVVFTPVYNHFYSSILNSSRKVLEVPLIYDGKSYQMDFEAIEAVFAENSLKLCVLCNPGNPTSRIWSKEELTHLAKLAKQYDVIILSDEIHGLITRPGTSYVPFLTCCEEAREIGVTTLSVSKGFNIAGLKSAAIIGYNLELLKKIDRQANKDEVAEPNSFALVAAAAALNEGEAWLDEMNEYVFDNREFAVRYIQEHMPELVPIDGDATYLLWVDISKISNDSEGFCRHLVESEHLLFNEGSVYRGKETAFIRINIATTRSILLEGLRRLEHGYKTRK